MRLEPRHRAICTCITATINHVQTTDALHRYDVPDSAVCGYATAVAATTTEASAIEWGHTGRPAGVYSSVSVVRSLDAVVRNRGRAKSLAPRYASLQIAAFRARGVILRAVAPASVNALSPDTLLGRYCQC